MSGEDTPGPSAQECAELLRKWANVLDIPSGPFVNQDLLNIATFLTETAAERDRLRAEVERLKAWVTDLQSGLYVNCVYCGHRYGPGETTPVSMADALKAHIEQCPQHPMSALRAEKAELVPLIAKIAAINIWRDQYSDGPDAVTADMSSDGARCIFTADEIRTARAALAKATATEGDPDAGLPTAEDVRGILKATATEGGDG